MDYKNVDPHEVLLEVIADIEVGHARMLAARNTMIDSSLASRQGYEHLAARINSTLVSSDAALDEANRMLGEP
jgi:hypothetical protein